MKKKDRAVKHWDEVPLIVDPYYVSEMLRTSVNTVYAWIKQGRLKAVKLGGRAWRINRCDLMAFLEVGENAS